MPEVPNETLRQRLRPLQGGLKSISPLGPDDLIFVAYSFEPPGDDRGQSAHGRLLGQVRCRVLQRGNTRANRIQARQDAFHQMRRKLTDHVDALVEVKGSLCNPSVQLNSFRDLFANKRIDPESVKNVTIDLTCLQPGEPADPLFELLDSYFPAAKKRVLYVSPEGYGDWLSTASSR